MRCLWGVNGVVKARVCWRRRVAIKISFMVLTTLRCRRHYR
jgi:hypothetical protein